MDVTGDIGEAEEAMPRPGVQRINTDGIRVQSIVDQIPVDAVDVREPGALAGGEVCFPGTEGRLNCLDARTSARPIRAVNHHQGRQHLRPDAGSRLACLPAARLRPGANLSRR